ncbi:MAG TPA: chemotaxis protein CheW [Devosia sp.]|jgi:purine-binding chemotaxis protein CheW|uniref:chemotaxis protein CheW n=1 Tax=Devosia sp. TaxID=1871048 RepID=UPI002F93E80E
MDFLSDQEPQPAGSTLGAADAATANQFVTFTCGQRLFGIEIMSVREIRKWSQTTPMPSQPYGACGVLDIRGSIVEIYDLAAMLGAHSAEEEASKVILVVSLGDRDVGVIADTVSDIIFAKPEDLRPAPNGKGRGESSVAKLVKSGDQLIAVLDLDVLFPSYTSH